MSVPVPVDPNVLRERVARLERRGYSALAIAGMIGGVTADQVERLIEEIRYAHRSLTTSFDDEEAIGRISSRLEHIYGLSMDAATNPNLSALGQDRARRTALKAVEDQTNLFQSTGLMRRVAKHDKVTVRFEPGELNDFADQYLAHLVSTGHEPKVATGVADKEPNKMVQAITPSGRLVEQRGRTFEVVDAEFSKVPDGTDT